MAVVDYVCSLPEMEALEVHRKVRQIFFIFFVPLSTTDHLCWGKTHDNTMEVPAQVCRGLRLHPNLVLLQH
jgi:hypothetical protein